MWIYNHKRWPNFTWDSQKLESQLGDLRYKQGKLLGKLDHLGFEMKQEASLKFLTNDVVKSSAIEGEMLNAIEVRSSIAHRLGLDIGGLVPASRDVEGVVEMMLDATQQFKKTLTAKRLFAWHAALFPTGQSGMHKITVGAWRKGKVDVVSGPIGREKIHFEGPPANRLKKEMNQFLKWFEKQDTLDPVLKAGLAHLWFVTLHPFDDGNGRIARAIADMALARADNSANRFYSMSSQIEAERKDYYDQLERQQHATPDVTQWLKWFLGCLTRSLEIAEKTINGTLFKWRKINQEQLNGRQQHVLTRMLEESFKGYMNTSKYAKMAKCSNDTALRDIQDLVTKEVLFKNPGGGRSTSYRLGETD